MRTITLLQPQKTVFGTGCIDQFADDYLKLGYKRLFIVTMPVVRPAISALTDKLAANGVCIKFYEDVHGEPSIADFKAMLKSAEDFEADSFIGIGGGSILDLTKLAATLVGSTQQIEDLFGTGLIERRGKWFACAPTTAGTGSEMSPNAILLDERDALKKGVVSPYLIADAAYIDPKLTWTVPAKITAETGMDAITHCIEAYTNKFAHPMVDMFAIKGISLIAANLAKAVKNGNDVEAREALAAGSMYGGCAGGRSMGLRINPECSTQEGHAIYDPCAPFSRLGTTLEQMQAELTEEEISELDGFHFHTLCEQNSDDLATTLRAVEEKFGKYLHQMKWVNFGGGHHITREDYDLELLKKCIRHVKETYDVEVYLEPGEAVALNAGEMITEVLEIVDNGMKIAILDASAACHMPDVLEMPYRPPLKDAWETNAEESVVCRDGSETAEDGSLHGECAGGRQYIYRLAGPTCLAGDVIGDYAFDHPLQCGERLEFQDMAIYTMVKTNTFNGMNLPDIVLEREDGECEIVRTFGYEDFKSRL